VNDHRASLLATTAAALESAEQASRAVNQVSLFADLSGPAARPAAAEVPRWSTKERLQNEKLALGYYFSGHLFNVYREEVGRFIRTRLADLSGAGGGDNGGRSYWIAGVVLGIRVQNTASGRMGVIQIGDDTGRYEIVAFREVFEKHRHKLKEDDLLVLEVRLRAARTRGGPGDGESVADFGLRIEAFDILTLQEARGRFARGVRLVCNGSSEGSRLRDVLAPYRSGTCPVSVVYANRGAICEIDLGESWRVNLHEELIRSLNEWLSPENVRIVYNEPRAAQ
jgi:DNA polymerase-3 subunit alpha